MSRKGLELGEGYKQCSGECGEILPEGSFGFTVSGERKWSACGPCREVIVQNVRAQAKFRANQRRLAGELRTCLGAEAYRLCEVRFRSISIYNRLCDSCKRREDYE